MELRLLGKRAVACKGWKWLPGMAWVMWEADGTETRGRLMGDDPSAAVLSFGWPDFSDDLTRTGVLVLVREAWGDQDIHLQPSLAGWWAQSGELRYAGHHAPCIDTAYPTELEASLAALETAP